MRSVFAGIFFVACFMLSCAKKTTPAASTTTTTTNPATNDAAAAAEIKTTVATVTESSMSVAGHTIYDAKCGRCHGLKNPGDYTVNQWADIMEKMAPKARLDSAQKATVLAYVNYHSKS